MKNPALLPSGFTDLLPPDAGREAGAISKLMETFAAFGYSRVKPPLLEFEESLFAGAGASMMNETFRVMDPVSHRMMGVRSDITPQIARIASSRLGKDPRPLRISYANDVLRTKAGQQRTERQFTQVGCEIIGEKNIEADIESCVVALIALSALGIKNITIDLAYPRLVTDVLMNVPDEARDKILKALERKSADGVKKASKKLGKSLAGLLNAAGSAESALKKLDALSLKGEAARQIKQLKNLYKGVARGVSELGLQSVQITIDPVERRGFKYYSGMGFTLFAKGVSGALGRGGHYNINKESASGFTLYMDTVRQSLPPARDKKIIHVGYDLSWGKIREKQKKGSVVVRGKK